MRLLTKHFRLGVPAHTLIRRIDIHDTKLVVADHDPFRGIIHCMRLQACLRSTRNDLTFQRTLLVLQLVHQRHDAIRCFVKHARNMSEFVRSPRVRTRHQVTVFKCIHDAADRFRRA